MATIDISSLGYDKNNPIYMAGRTAMGNAFDPAAFATAPDAGLLKRLAAQLYGSDASKNYMQNTIGSGLFDAAKNEFAKKNITKASPEALSTLANKLGVTADKVAQQDMANMRAGFANPLSFKKVDGVAPIATTGSLLGANIAAHPGAAIGTTVNAAGNVAGLFDNDKLLGQVAGTVGGALLGPKMFGLGPFGSINAAMLGGNLGALFDSLRAKREQDRAAAETVQQTY